MTEAQEFFRRVNRDRRIRTVLQNAEAAKRAICTCTHERQRHLFGRKCDMARCKCKTFDDAFTPEQKEFINKVAREPGS
jgi:hypothetical protein